MNEKDYNKMLSESAMNISSQDILDSYGITEYTADDIVRDFDDAVAYKQEQARIFKILDAADHSDIWKVFNRPIPSFQQTPNNNLITVIKEATKASIMPTSYAGEFKPMSMEAKELANTANKFFQTKWNATGMDAVNDDAGEYAFLHGTSGVLFGWNENIIDHEDTTNYFKFNQNSSFQAKAYHPSNIFPDPTANTVEEMRFLFFAERKSKAFLKTIPRFTNAIYNIENSNDTIGQPSETYRLDNSKNYSLDVVTFITCYKRVIRQTVDPITGIPTLRPSVDIIYMAGRNILDVSKDIQPSIIPFVPLYDENVPNNFWGISKCYKVLSLVLALNQLDSIEATGYFKNQNPAEFINALAGINVPEYQRKRNNPDAAFTVNCDPRIVQAYAQRPDIPKNVDTFRQYLIQSIQQVSGVDSVYLGRSFGSIQTTGGVDSAIERSTMRDTNRIKKIDTFIKREIEIMVQFYIIHGKKENFYVANKQDNQVPGEQLSFDPASLVGRDDILINVSNCAPRSNASYEEAAMKIMELQMKYIPAEHGYPDFITPEEFIGWLNIPKDQQTVLIERMKNQMTNMKLEEYMAVLTGVGTLTQGGMPVEQALQEIATQMENTVLGQIPATNPNTVKPM